MNTPHHFSFILIWLMGLAIAGEATDVPCRTANNNGLVTNAVQRKVTDAKPAPGIVDTLFLNSIVEQGFPVKAYHDGGSYHGGPAVCTVIADIKGDSRLEILVTALAVGPLYCFDHAGNLLTGWPVAMPQGGAAYPAVDDRRVVAGSYDGDIVLVDSLGYLTWQKQASNYIACPPAIAYSQTQSSGCFFIGEEDWKLHGYRVDNGNSLAGWPFYFLQSQEWHTPAVFISEGRVKIVSVSGTANSIAKTVLLDEDGTLSPGWDSVEYYSTADTYPAVGDVDGDGQIEIVVITRDENYPWTSHVRLLHADGIEERSWPLAGTINFYSTAAIADVDGNGRPDVIVQCNDTVNVNDGSTGLPLPGWPVAAPGWAGNSAPVIGDVDGDSLMEVVVTANSQYSSETGELHVFNRLGQEVAGFPLQINISNGAAPAIADIDLDGHNEIIVTGSYWSGIPGNYDKVWAFDLDRDATGVNHGRIEWGQFMHDERHSGFYGPPVTGVTGRMAMIPPVQPSLTSRPNPFASRVAIRYSCPSPAMAHAAIYDITGRRVHTLFSGRLGAGIHQWNWDGRGSAPGVYFCRISTGNATATHRLVHFK